MSESNNDRWARHLAPFDVAPQPLQRPIAPVEDRSWMPTPTVMVGASGVDWHKDGKWREVWKQPLDFAAKHEPNFHARIVALESELSGLEKTLPPYHPRIAPVRQQLGKYYSQLSRIYDGWIKQQPLTRY